MVGGPTGRFGHHARKTQRRQIQFVDERLDDTNRIVFPNVVVQALR
jgi:hypothetical protein